MADDLEAKARGLLMRIQSADSIERVTWLVDAFRSVATEARKEALEEAAKATELIIAELRKQVLYDGCRCPACQQWDASVSGWCVQGDHALCVDKIYMVRRNVDGFPQGYREDVAAFSTDDIARKWIAQQPEDARFYYDVRPYDVDALVP